MFLGMGTVFLFLVLMIFFMNVMSKLIYKYFPEPAEINNEPQVVQKEDNKKVIAAISAAIAHHRQQA